MCVKPQRLSEKAELKTWPGVDNASGVAEYPALTQPLEKP
jgi:hypothetical protein